MSPGRTSDATAGRAVGALPLVPRALAALGMTASVLQVAGVPLRAILGQAPDPRWAMPRAPIYVALAVWLLTVGFRGRPAAAAPAASARGR